LRIPGYATALAKYSGEYSKKFVRELNVGGLLSLEKDYNHLFAESMRFWAMEQSFHGWPFVEG